MKANKAIKNLTILIVILLIAVLSCISFFGILKKDLNTWKNIIPEYSFSKEIEGEGISSFTFYVDDSTKEVEEVAEEKETSEEKVDEQVNVDETVSTEESNATATAEENTEEEKKTKTVPVNEESALNKDNYKKSKKIIQERLETFGISDYNVRLNEDNGKIEVEIPYDSDVVNNIAYLVTDIGKVEIIDSETNEVLLDNSDIKKATAGYKLSENDENTVDESDKKDSYDFNIQFEFTKDGLKKYQDMTKKYVDTLNEEGESEPKTITVKIDDKEKYKTYFDASGNYTYLSIPLYQGVSDEDELTKNNTECIRIQNAINIGKIPVVYKLDTTSSYYMETNNKINIITVSVVILICVVVAISIVLILKNKKLGIYALLLEIGYIASLLLIIRYATVTLSVTGLLAILGATILNYYFIIKMLKNSEKRYLQALKDYILIVVPLIIFTVVFVYSKTLQLKSMGMVFVWGILITVIYNAIVSNLLLNNCDKETLKGADK